MATSRLRTHSFCNESGLPVARPREQHAILQARSFVHVLYQLAIHTQAQFCFGARTTCVAADRLSQPPKPSGVEQSLAPPAGRGAHCRAQPRVESGKPKLWQLCRYAVLEFGLQPWLLTLNAAAGIARPSAAALSSISAPTRRRAERLETIFSDAKYCFEILSPNVVLQSQCSPFLSTRDTVAESGPTLCHHMI